MIGELIPTGYTFSAGREAINNAFSGTAMFNEIEIVGNITGSTIEVSQQLNNPFFSSTIGPSIVPDFNDSLFQKYILTANTFIHTPLNMKSGTICSFILIQDAIGGRSVQWGYPTYNMENGAAPIISSGASSANVVQYICDGTTMYIMKIVTNIFPEV